MIDDDLLELNVQHGLTWLSDHWPTGLDALLEREFLWNDSILGQAWPDGLDLETWLHDGLCLTIGPDEADDYLEGWLIGKGFVPGIITFQPGADHGTTIRLHWDRLEQLWRQKLDALRASRRYYRGCDACNRSLPRGHYATQMAGGAEGTFCCVCRHIDNHDLCDLDLDD